MKQVPGRHAPKHHARRLPGGDAVRKGHQAMGRHAAHLGVGSWRNAGIGHPVPGLEVRNIGTHRFHHPGTFQAQDGGDGRQWIQSRSMIHIDKIEPDGLLVQPYLPGARCARIKIFPPHDRGASRFMDSDGFGHGVLLCKKEMK
jgi:hypothetical protein